MTIPEANPEGSAARRLLIISDTALRSDTNGNFGLEPVVREVTALLSLFREITWIGFDRPDLMGDHSLVPIPPSIRCVRLARTGGDSTLQKAGVLLRMPTMLRTIMEHVGNADVIHTRSPSSPALIGILLSYGFRRARWWHKYAGNWAQASPPLMYRVQRSLLTHARHSAVTINGKWPRQEPHCHTFPNPCLDSHDRRVGQQVVASKNYNGPLKACYVGRVERAKGIGRVMAAIRGYEWGRMELTVAGDGVDLAEMRLEAARNRLPCTFLGPIDRSRLQSLYSDSHLLLLPSTASEGFPKVIAEAWNYGCVPVVSDVSAIPQYVRESNGYVWPVGASESFETFLNRADFSEPLLRAKGRQGHIDAEAFSFAAYLQKVRAIAMDARVDGVE